LLQTPRVRPSPATDVELERSAARLARAAGERIIAAAASRTFAVHFKTPRAGHATNSNPVSDIDRAVEAFIRAELASTHPEHAVIGEEEGGETAKRARYVWAVDPVDGTTNFVNGLPLVASSIGVLCDGEPVAGAIWCAATHALRPGVYHARRGGPLCFDGEPLARRRDASWRRLAAEPGSSPQLGEQWDLRVLGSATLELAYTAAGLLELAYLSGPSLWDAAAGLALLNAAGCAALTRADGHWQPLARFEGDLAAWNAPLLAGDAESLSRATEILARIRRSG
jgi:myo-inositol-1(or 4)-monophosphatase